MKKLKTAGGILLLSVMLTGNLFAAPTSEKTFFGIFDSVIGTLTFFTTSSSGQDDNCSNRICQNCKPEETDSDGNCRPRDE